MFWAQLHPTSWFVETGMRQLKATEHRACREAGALRAESGQDWRLQMVLAAVCAAHGNPESMAPPHSDVARERAGR
jgi:hypothetical protein